MLLHSKVGSGLVVVLFGPLRHRGRARVLGPAHDAEGAVARSGANLQLLRHESAGEQAHKGRRH